MTVKSDGSSAIDDLRLYNVKIRLYLIRFFCFVVDYRNFLEYPVTVHLTDMLSGTNYSVNKVKHDFNDIIIIIIITIIIIIIIIIISFMHGIYTYIPVCP